MKLKYQVVVAAFVVAAVGSAAAGATAGQSSVSEARHFSPLHTAIQENKQKDVPPPEDAPLTRDEVLKQGPLALQQNCNRCHGSDKWEGTNRDRDGWAAIVNEMSRQMSLAQMPPMSARTTNIIIDYLTLTHPQ